MKRVILFVLIALAGRIHAESLFSPQDQALVAEALDALVMTPADAGFEKDVGKPVWALSWVTNTLQDPWRLPEVGDRIFGAAREGAPGPLWILACDLLEGSAPPEPGSRKETEPREAQNLPPSTPSFLAPFLLSLPAITNQLGIAFRAVSPGNRAYLAAATLHGIFDAEDDEAARAALLQAGIPGEMLARVEEEGRRLDGTEASLFWLEEAKTIDRGALAEAGRMLQESVSALTDLAAELDAWPDVSQVIETAWGKIVIGTRGDDVHAGPALLVIDPDGDDRYLDGAGAANGLMGHPVSVLVDLAGDDVFDAAALLGAGTALWGVTAIMEAGGDDLYRADYAGQGAAFFGASWFEDRSGDDAYRARAHAQAAATVGYGMLIDDAGNDAYEVGFYGQGFGGVMGWGSLIDREGHDRYLAGNDLPDHDRNPERFLSLAQGFSFGMRPHAGGGVGALVDLEGNDTYMADVYGQAVSYYYAAGFLLDAAGHDTYSMYQYGQGCGIHLSHGLLADLGGNDTYSGFILSQGSAHDYAVGMLLEHGGNDTYTGDHHTQGRALNNAFALLLDRAGNDGYFARQRDGGQGIGNNGGFRDYGSLAVLVDAAGADVYSGGFSNGATTIRPSFGVIHDVDFGF
ncbi:MAG: hypothetical protein ACO3ZG_07675 [Kiritimatiellia bacterium]